MTERQDPSLECEIFLESRPPPLHQFVVRLSLLDVTLVDAPAQVVMERVLPGSEFASQGKATLPCDQASLSETADYIIRVHLSRTGNPQVQIGDWVSVESHPVLTHGYGNHVRVRLKEVR